MADNANQRAEKPNETAEKPQSSRSPKGFSMQKIGKEVKIGLAVIGVLLVAFGYVLVKRLSRPGDAIASTDSP
ncbi:MAG TPA: hypothetical protein VKB78_08470, partial [Pirellulales bacterium]|nr:hypothetical protein [Pirellulales bacterium]